MNLSELRYAVAVAREKNFRRASEKSFISQPALSTAIQKLEDELGIQLFERSRTEVTVTPIGQQLIEQAQRILEEVERLKLIAQSGQDSLQGPLKLGVIHTIGPYLLPDLIPALAALAPQMSLDVEESTTAQLETQLKNGALDVIVIALPFDIPGVEIWPLYDECFEVVVPARHPFAKRASLAPGDLAHERVLRLHAGHCFSHQVAEACPELREAPGSSGLGNSLETIRNMVASGAGITVLPASANSERYRSQLLAVIPFEAPAPSRRVALATRKSFGRHKAIEAVKEAICHLTLPGVTRLP